MSYSNRWSYTASTTLPTIGASTGLHASMSFPSFAGSHCRKDWIYLIRAARSWLITVPSMCSMASVFVWLLFYLRLLTPFLSSYLRNVARLHMYSFKGFINDPALIYTYFRGYDTIRRGCPPYHGFHNAILCSRYASKQISHNEHYAVGKIPHMRRILFRALKPLWYFGLPDCLFLTTYISAAPFHRPTICPELTNGSTAHINATELCRVSNINIHKKYQATCIVMPRGDFYAFACI